MLFKKNIVVLSVVIFVSWTEGNQASDGVSLKEPDHGRVNSINTEANGNDSPRQKRGKVVGVVINQEGNVYGDGLNDDNVGIYVKQENNVFRNNDPEGETYEAVIHQNNNYRATSAESDSTKRQDQQSAAQSAKPIVQNHQYVRNQQSEHRSAPIYPVNYSNSFAAHPPQPQTFRAPPSYVYPQQSRYNGPTRQARVLQAPVYRPVPQFNGTTMDNNLKTLKERLDSLTVEVGSLKETMVRLLKLLNLDK